MEKRIYNTFGYLRDTVTSRVAFGDSGSCPIDQTPAQSFNIDPHTGRPMSDIQRLVHIQNDMQLASEFSQLQEFKSNFLPKEMSDTEAIKFAVPRLSQLPSEIISHRLSCAKQLFEKQAAEKEAVKAKKEAELLNKVRENMKKRVSKTE